MEGVANLLGGVEAFTSPGSVSELLPRGEVTVGLDLATANDEEPPETHGELFLHTQSQFDLEEWIETRVGGICHDTVQWSSGTPLRVAYRGGGHTGIPPA